MAECSGNEAKVVQSLCTLITARVKKHDECWQTSSGLDFLVSASARSLTSRTTRELMMMSFPVWPPSFGNKNKAVVGGHVSKYHTCLITSSLQYTDAGQQKGLHKHPDNGSVMKNKWTLRLFNLFIHVSTSCFACFSVNVFLHILQA